MSVETGESPLSGSGPAAERPRYSIVVPAYNESKRLGGTLQQILDHVHRQKWSVEIVVVDDGSRDDTVQIAGQFAAHHPEIRLIKNPGNRGKGYAVRNGMLQTRGEVLLFTDADLSAPITEAGKLFAALQGGADVAIGSRWLDPSLQFRRQSLRRRLLSRLYHIYLRLLLGLHYRDTQCGFKAFTSSAAAIIFPMQRIQRWGFDPEILYLARCQGMKVVEIPVAWGHGEGSKINPLRDGIRMGTDALKIRWYAWTGKYRRGKIG